MLSYIIRRVIYMVPTLVVLSMIIFFIIDLPPGDYLTNLQAQLEAQGEPSAEFELQRLKQRYALDRPLPIKYARWMAGVVQGDFGESFEWQRPVSELIGEQLVLTMVLSITTMAFTWIVAIPIGIYCAVRQYSLGDQIFTFIGFIGLATPSFLLALLMMFVSVFWFNADTVGGLFSPQYADAPWSIGKILDLMTHIWIPVIIVGASGTASLIRIMRGNLLDVLKQQFVQTARAKGLTEHKVIFRHAVPIAINPLISIAGMQMPHIISGATITAIVLNLPTTGPLLYRALLSQDMFLAGSFLMFLTALLLFGNLLADLALAWVDPRIRYE